ncbi:hypothetical protein ACFPRL_23540 [Pseudoclavibacter helvolus]
MSASRRSAPTSSASCSASTSTDASRAPCLTATSAAGSSRTPPLPLTSAASRSRTVRFGPRRLSPRLPTSLRCSVTAGSPTFRWSTRPTTSSRSPSIARMCSASATTRSVTASRRS